MIENNEQYQESRNLSIDMEAEIEKLADNKLLPDAIKNYATKRLQDIITRIGVEMRAFQYLKD